MENQLPKVDKNVPIPDVVGPNGRRPGRAEKYPWSRLEIGDSFWVDEGSAALVAVGKTRAERRLGIKLVTRKEGAGRRVWRVA